MLALYLTTGRGFCLVNVFRVVLSSFIVLCVLPCPAPRPECQPPTPGPFAPSLFTLKSLVHFEFFGEGGGLQGCLSQEAQATPRSFAEVSLRPRRPLTPVQSGPAFCDLFPVGPVQYSCAVTPLLTLDCSCVCFVYFLNHMSACVRPYLWRKDPGSLTRIKPGPALGGVGSWPLGHQEALRRPPVASLPVSYARVLMARPHTRGWSVFLPWFSSYEP